MAATRRREPRARAAVVALPPRARAGGRAARFLPSRRSVALGLCLLALAGAAYAGARESSAFAVRRLELAGAPPQVRGQARKALAPLLGTSLLALDGGALERRLEALPSVVSARYDRAFPHTLRVTLVPETAVAVLHRGRRTWLVSARARVIAPIRPGTLAGLPRIWVPAATPVAPGAFLADARGGTSARALALARRFPARIATAALGRGGLVFRLRSGLVVRLGDPTDVRLKLAVARRALARLPAGTTYVDVSVPGRPVAGTDPRLSGRG